MLGQPTEIVVGVLLSPRYFQDHHKLLTIRYRIDDPVRTDSEPVQNVSQLY
ncbi:MAG TPA: hypothetical protein VNL15_00890 [Dehalococcoidia bacterium]|nr:hypothetical protein [Dehalococcoidia bacterium]